jgi:NAD-dependent SIR2 family protein deacetylase
VEWDEHEQALILALAEYKSSLCPRCHGDMEETTDPAHEDRYVPKLPIRCHRCDGLIRSENAYTEKAGTDRPAALLHQVELRRPRG